MARYCSYVKEKYVKFLFLFLYIQDVFNHYEYRSWRGFSKKECDGLKEIKGISHFLGIFV